MNALDFTLDELTELDPNPAPTTTLEADMQRFLSILWHGAPYGMFQNLNAGPAHDKRRSVYIPEGEPAIYPSVWDNNYSNIFHCVNPAILRRDYYEAVRKDDIAAINQLYREYDAKDFTDPTPADIESFLPIVKKKDDQRIAEAFAKDPAAKEKPANQQSLQNQALGMAKDAKFKANPEPYMKMVRAHVDALTPAPSVIVKSGGGYQCYWLLTETLIIRTHPDDQAAHVQAYAEDLQRRWVHLDKRADQGVNELRRILRTPGTFNHKPKYAPDYPQVTFYQKRFNLRYKLAGFVQLMPPPVVTESPRIAQDRTQSTSAQNGVPYAGNSVIDAYNAAHNLTTMLVEYGYTHAGGNRYRRPGGVSGSVEVFPSENNARIWSSSDPLYNGEHRCTPFTVFCVYDHNGNLTKAVAAAALELGMVRSPKASPGATIERARSWLQTANFAELIPQALQSAKGYRTNATDKRLYSAYLDIFQSYGAQRGPISNSQLSLAAGFSEGTVRNAQKRLIAAVLIRKVEAPAGNEGGAFFYELVTRDFDSCVDCAVLGITSDKPYRAIYATKTFTTLKAHDAFQRGGSKRQRQTATIKAIGPDALLLADVLADRGTLTQTAVATYTHQSKYTVSRLVKRMESLEIITVRAEGSRRFLSLNVDWLDTVKELTPKMPTYGMAFRRELNVHTRTVDNCERQLARKIGNPERIEKQLERAANKAFALMEREVEFTFDSERQAEIMRRLTRHGAMNRAAAVSAAEMQNNLSTLEFSSFMGSEMPKPWLANYDNGRLARMASTLADNEMLLDARRQMLYEDLTPAPAINAEIYSHHQMALGGAA